MHALVFGGKIATVKDDNNTMQANYNPHPQKKKKL
jgi:hypothetical protein